MSHNPSNGQAPRAHVSSPLGRYNYCVHAPPYLSAISRFFSSRTAFFIIAVASPRKGRLRVALQPLTRRLPTAGCLRMLMRDSFSRSLYQAFRLIVLMPTQKDTQSHIARKVNFAIQLLRETAELLETSPRSSRPTFSAKRSRSSAVRQNVGPRDE